MLKGIRKKTAILMALLLCLSMADYSALMTAYAEETEETAETAVESEAEESVQELAETSTEEEDTNEGEYSLTYEVKDGNAVITGYTGELPSELVLPDTIDGYVVTEIGKFAFSGADITSTVIPDGVTTIGGFAFDNSGISEIYFSGDAPEFTYYGVDSFLLAFYPEDNPTWTEDAREHSGAENIQWVPWNPETGETKKFEHSYGEYTLMYMGDDGNATIIGYIGELPSELVLPDTIDGYAVTEISHNVFEDTDITSVVIPNGVTTIGCYAFVDCEQLVSVQIPDSVVTIEYWVFGDCISLDSINIPDGITTIESGVFYGCSSLKNINIPDSVTTIGAGAFSYCKSLESINIPDSVTTIEEATFEGCSSLKGISIPDSVTSIGVWTFAGCENLESINIPDGVTIIKGFTFYECKQLVSVEIPDSVTEIEYHVFDSCESLENITIPNSVIEIGETAFANCDALKEVKLPSSLKVISEELFILCDNLVSVEIPDSVTKIESLAFSGCKSLKTISIPENVSYIGGRAFINSGISEIYFLGNAPEFDSDNEYPDVFEGDTLIIFYPADNPTWTEDVMQPYGAESIEWIPWDPETEEIQGSIDVVDDSVDGENEIGVHIIGSGDDLVLECNLPLQYFVSVEIDGVTVDPSNYELKSGSTIITFDGSFLDTLTPGNHTVTMHYNINGRKVAVKTSIVIREKSGSSDKPSKPNTSDSSKPSKPSNSDSSKPSNGSTGTDNETAAAAQNKVTMKAHLVDANGQPMYNCTLEIHSKPVSATLGTDGTASFKNIEVGDHTMYLKDQNGKVLASKAIKIVHDKTYSITGGDTIHVVKGRAFILNVKYDGENLILLSVEGDQTPETGDTSTAHIWILLMALSAMGMVLVLARKRKQIR